MCVTPGKILKIIKTYQVLHIIISPWFGPFLDIMTLFIGHVTYSYFLNFLISEPDQKIILKKQLYNNFGREDNE